MNGCVIDLQSCSEALDLIGSYQISASHVSVLRFVIEAKQEKFKITKNLPIICLFSHFKGTCFKIEANNKAVFAYGFELE